MSLQVENISYEVQGKHILKQVSLQLEAGQSLALVGNNGSGKSTLLKAITGELLPQSNAIRLEQRPRHLWPRQTLARKMAFLPQHSQINFNFTCEELVAMGRYPHSTGQQRDQEIIDAAMTLTDVYQFRYDLVTHMSGGELQRSQLARVLAQIWEPLDGFRLLVLDEPTNGLDLIHQHSVFQAIQAFKAQQLAIIFVVHDLNLAARYGDRVMVMDQGQVAVSGTPAEVFTKTNIKQYFGLDVCIQTHPVFSIPNIIPV
ncbi:heme ABC transporter ATP-binding protein [Gynuella sunshinyii]|uniref:ABC-type hemin transport system, ATPase component n=1 Tax=Gynuella sunshinyii YC6258 TaxID=1445510 RepID=A0A0C5V3D6_9GAMM|nr:heme ABC transporter ATP-binding protein [Gynuella sunshinyii]AJQ94045.1 ABC-type hemin transport system, ATPase component [Gynuella sunshinyii YC6258]